MPQVHHVKHARKARKQYGIRKGDSYYWWKHRRKGCKNGYKCFSKEKPRRSQLTLSDYFRTAYAIEESVEDLLDGITEWTPDAVTDLAANVREAAEEARNLGQEQRDKYENLPENFQQGSSGESLESRADACECTASELESAADELESLEPITYDEGEEDDENPTIQSAAVQLCLAGISWDWGN